MSKVSWNEFRSLHKGTASKEIKELWAQYKEGVYEIETNPKKKATPKTVVADKPEETPRKEFLRLFNELYILNDPTEAEKSLYRRLLKLAEMTRPDGYTTGRGDGWTIYLGPTQKTVLVNETRRVAFSITRSYWQRFYQGAALVDTQMFDDENGIERLKKQYKRMGALVTRYPLPEIEIMVPRSSLDIPLPSGVE
jgi:hypothetical protein